MRFRGIVLMITAVMCGTLPMTGHDRNARSISGTRSPVLALNGMVCASQPLASAAGLRILAWRAFLVIMHRP